MVLPAPFGPRKPKIEFLVTFRFSDCNALTPLKALVRSWVLMTSGLLSLSVQYPMQRSLIWQCTGQ
jgi:hypothetical protein